MYAHRIVKPMFAYFEEVHHKLEKNNVEMENNNDQMKKLGLEVASCSSKDTIIKLLEDKDETNRVLIQSLQQQVDLLAKANKKLENNLTDKQTKEIIEMKEKFETAFKSQSETLAETQKKVIHLETEVMKSIHNSNEIESLKQKMNNLTISIEKQNIELEKLKLKVNDNKKSVKKNPKSCKDIDIPGVHSITPFTDITLQVLCNYVDLAGPGWTVILQRINGGVEFQRNWTTYQNGFGDFFDGDFFLGLEKIHRLTTDQPHELYIHMQRFNGTSYYARYEEFAISGEEDQYTLSKLIAFSGSTVDELHYSLNAKFTTFDRDNDSYSGNCANSLYGGWWYKDCTRWYVYSCVL